MSRIYCKNNHLVVREPDEARDASRHEKVSFLGVRDVSVPRGRVDEASGLILLNTDELVTSPNSHEVIVVASSMRGVSPGERVIIFLGGDSQGEVSANGISAFVKVEGEERWVVHQAFVWAKVKDGEVLPLHHIVLTERNDEAFKRHVLGAGSVLFPPEQQLTGGMRATGDDANEQILASVTALYETVARTGADVKDLSRGETLCFSPSFSATRLKRRVGKETRYYHLVDSRDAFFTVD